MNIALWIISGLLGLAFLAAGSMKLSKSRAELNDAGMDWVEEFTDGQVKAIGLAELLGAIGVVVPGAVDIAPILVPIAATGLTLTMAGAAAFHVRRNDPPAGAAPSIVLGLLSIIVAIGRFGPEAF